MAVYQKITKPILNAEIASYNSTAAAGEANLLKTVDNLLFPPAKIPYEKDTVGFSQTLPTTLSLLFELQKAKSAHTISVSSDGGQKVIVLGRGNATLTDQGDDNFLDKGDVIVAGSGHYSLTASPTDDDTLYAGALQSTLMGGAGADKLYGGGKTDDQAGIGANSLYGGLRNTAHDTLLGSTGHDLLSVSHGANLLSAGSGLNTLYGGTGHDTLFGGGSSSIVAGAGFNRVITAAGKDTVVLTHGGDAHVTAAAGTLVDFGGKSGNDTVNAGGNNVVVDIVHEHLKHQHTAGSTTTYTFKDGQTLVVSGSNTTVNFT
jgi:hypothetical protein